MRPMTAPINKRGRPITRPRRVAAQLARLHKARLVMGSATPLISDYFTFEKRPTDYSYELSRP